MTVLDQETRDLFDRTVRAVLAQGEGGDRTEALEESGWRDVLLTDRRAAVPLVFRAQGELRARSAALDDVAIDAIGPDAGARFDELDGAAWVHPSPGHGPAARADGQYVVVDGLALRGHGATRVAMLASRDGGASLVTLMAGALELTPVAGMDPTLGLVRLRGRAPAVSSSTDPMSLTAVEAACRRAISYELLGLASTMLAMASEYAGARVQFGQPIGVFQSVKHRLADVFVAVRAAEVVADESWDALSEPDAELAVAATKCLAGRAGRVAAENCLQVMGAIGFTEEHVLHRFIARATVLDVLYGSARSLRADLGRMLLARGTMPRLGLP